MPQGGEWSMESTFLTTAILSTRFVKASLETVLDHDMAHEHWDKIQHVLQQVGVIHDTLFHMRNELCRLQAENQQLRQRLQAQQA
jgi:hypothetical protein